MGDKELIDALREGRGSAWKELVGRYLRLVYHVVRKTLETYARTAHDADVEDISHDLFESLLRDNYRALASIGAPYDLKAWLAVSARRRAIDFVRRKDRAALSLDARRKLRDGLESPAAEGEPREEFGAAVRESLAVLNPRERLVVQLFYLDEKKYVEISRITGINTNSISPTLSRALEKMQKHLADRNLSSR